MYDLAEVVGHTNALWSAIGSRIDGAPKWLSRPSSTPEMHALWKHPELVLGQTCGWPLVTELWPLVTSGALNVVGTFWYHVSSDPGYYNAQHVYPNPMRDVYSPRSAVNSYDSLSGWVSHAYRNTEAITSVLLTGSHVETLRAIQSNTADMGTIDAVTYDLLRRHRPEAVTGILVSEGDLRVPCLPLITTRPVEEIREAIVDAIAQPELATDLDALAIYEFVPMDASHYEHLLRYSDEANFRDDRPGNSLRN